MKYVAIASLLLVLSLHSIDISTAQTRPRRVVQAEPGKSQSPPHAETTPQDPVVSLLAISFGSFPPQKNCLHVRVSRGILARTLRSIALPLKSHRPPSFRLCRRM